MDHFHDILLKSTDQVRPGNQIDANSFISARNQEIQALLEEIRKLLIFVNNFVLIEHNSNYFIIFSK